MKGKDRLPKYGAGKKGKGEGGKNRKGGDEEGRVCLNLGNSLKNSNLYLNLFESVFEFVVNPFYFASTLYLSFIVPLLLNLLHNDEACVENILRVVLVRFNGCILLVYYLKP